MEKIKEQIEKELNIKFRKETNMVDMKPCYIATTLDYGLMIGLTDDTLLIHTKIEDGFLEYNYDVNDDMQINKAIWFIRYFLAYRGELRYGFDENKLLSRLGAVIDNAVCKSNEGQEKIFKLINAKLKREEDELRVKKYLEKQKKNE